MRAPAMTRDLKLALWRIILTHGHRSRSTTDDHRSALTEYRIRLLAWLDEGGEAPIPTPDVPSTFKFQWALLRKVMQAIAHNSESSS